MTQQTKKADVKKTKLYSVLLSKIRAVNQSQLAKEARISTKTLYEIKSGRFTGKMPSQATDVSTRRLRGFVTSITRLALYLDLDVEETMKEVGIDPEWPGVREFIPASSRPRSKEPTEATRDPSDLDKDIYPLMRAICESLYEGKLTCNDLVCLLRVQETIARPLTAAAVGEILKLR